MKAVRIHQHGNIDVLSIDDIQKPIPNEEQVLIQIKSSSLNHLDLFVRNGFPGIPLPLNMGSDGSGIVKETGKLVKNFSIGDEVIIVPFETCGVCSACISGREQLCRKYVIRGEYLDGCQAEYIVLSEKYILPKPKNISFEEAAAFPLAYMTAYHMLTEKVQLKPEDHILIWGAASGIGSAAIQIAKIYDAKVITTVSSKVKETFAKQLGADFILNYKNENVAASVKDITNGKGVSVVFEHPGASTMLTSMRVLKMGGKIVTCGATTGPIFNLDIRHLFIKHQQIIGSTMGNRNNLSDLCKLIESGKISPKVSHRFPYTDIKKAHILLEEGKQIGKIVINFR
ncbi:zinc-binding dehydrogenase [Calditrichota bacterium]